MAKIIKFNTYNDITYSIPKLDKDILGNDRYIDGEVWVQYIGKVKAVKAKNLKIGDFRVYNGSPDGYRVTEIKKEKKYVTITLKELSRGNNYTLRHKEDTLIPILFWDEYNKILPKKEYRAKYLIERYFNTNLKGVNNNLPDITDNYREFITDKNTIELLDFIKENSKGYYRFYYTKKRIIIKNNDKIKINNPYFKLPENGFGFSLDFNSLVFSTLYVYLNLTKFEYKSPIEYEYYIKDKIENFFEHLFYKFLFNKINPIKFKKQYNLASIEVKSSTLINIYFNKYFENSNFTENTKKIMAFENICK